MRKSFYNCRHYNSTRRETPDYPSAPDTGCNTGKVEQQRYSGSAVKGVALLHKQAYTPVTDPIKTDPKRQ